jgi:histidine triad (HIT) family protein
VTAGKDDCLFCKILAGDIPSEQVASTEATYAFRDIQPTAPTHVLVIPREHIDHAHAIEPAHADTVAAMFATAQEVARTEGIDASGYRLVFNVGEDAQNSVPHLHMHVIGGRRMQWPPG